MFVCSAECAAECVAACVAECVAKCVAECVAVPTARTLGARVKAAVVRADTPRSSAPPPPSPIPIGCPTQPCKDGCADAGRCALPCVAACCSVLLWSAVGCSGVQRGAARCGVWSRAATARALWGDCRLTLQHALQHTLQHALQHTLQHALQHTLRAVGRLSFVRSDFLWKKRCRRQDL